MTNPIPAHAFNLLPFVPEPISIWNEQTRARRFLEAIFDFDGEVIDQSGTSMPVNSRSYGTDLFEGGRRELAGLISGFERAAARARPPFGVELPEPTVLVDDPMFGLVAQYYVAWDGFTNLLLSEDLFFSIAHTLASSVDLDASIHLCGHLFYKQSCQILRNFLEDVVMPLYFLEQRADYDAWKLGNRVPNMNGPSGMLAVLEQSGLLSAPERESVSVLYRQLNGSVHGREQLLTWEGVYTGSAKGKIFKRQAFDDWAMKFAQSVDLGLRLTLIGVDALISRSTAAVVCSVCHQDDDFEVTPVEFASRHYLEHRCRTCGSTTSRSSPLLSGVDPSGG